MSPSRLKLRTDRDDPMIPNENVLNELPSCVTPLALSAATFVAPPLTVAPACASNATSCVVNAAIETVAPFCAVNLSEAVTSVLNELQKSPPENITKALLIWIYYLVTFYLKGLFRRELNAVEVRVLFQGGKSQ